MPFELKLAWRYFRLGRKGLVRFTSVIAIVGIAFGVASLIIAQAIGNGFRNEIKDKILGNTAHINIFNESKIANWQIIKSKIEKLENVKKVEPTTYESIVVYSKENSSYGVLRVHSLDNADSIEISLGKELADKLKVKAGDEIRIITFDNEDSKKSKNLRVKEIFETGLYEYDSTWVYVNEKVYLELKEKDRFSPSVFNIYVKDIYKTDKTAEEIQKILGKGFRVLDWQETNKPLFSALSLERKASLAILFLIILIAVLNITTTLSLLVNEKKLDIAILRTCGAKTKSLVLMFLFQGLGLGFIGTFFGVVLGIIGCFLGNYFKILSISKEVYSLNYIPFQIDFFDILIIISITIFLCFLATIYPTLKACKIKPLENIRNQ